MFHLLKLNHRVDIQAHRAATDAEFAVRTGRSVCNQAQGGPGEAVAQPASDDHEGRHPANREAAGPASENDRQPNEQENDRKVDDVFFGRIHRNAGLRHIEQVDARISARPNQQPYDDRNPRNPD